MSSHSLLFLVGQIGVLCQVIGSLLLLKQAFVARKFGGPESGLVAIDHENEVSIDAIGTLGMDLTRDVKAQFSRQLPGFGFLFFGMACQFVGNFAAL